MFKIIACFLIWIGLYRGVSLKFDLILLICGIILDCLSSINDKLEDIETHLNKKD